MSDESQALQDVYSHVLDGELLQLLGDYANLTDTAKPLLQRELTRRGLNLPPEAATLSESDSSAEIDAPTVAAAVFEESDESEDVADFQISCPQCLSSNVLLLAPEVSAEVETSGGNRWLCDECTHAWIDEI